MGMSGSSSFAVETDRESHAWCWLCLCRQRSPIQGQDTTSAASRVSRLTFPTGQRPPYVYLT